MEAVIKERKTKQEAWGPAALDQRRERTRQHLAAIASRRESWIKRNQYYYEFLSRLLRFLVEPKKKVLSVRCGTGYHLAAVTPREGKGIDICTEIVEIARQRNPSFDFAVAFPDKDEFRTSSSRARNSITSYLTTSATRWMCFRRCVISDRFACGTRACW